MFVVLLSFSSFTDARLFGYGMYLISIFLSETETTGRGANLSKGPDFSNLSARDFGTSLSIAAGFSVNSSFSGSSVSSYSLCSSITGAYSSSSSS
jgi:hypothetical protein